MCMCFCICVDGYPTNRRLWAAQHQCWEPNSSPLHAKHPFLSFEPFLQPQRCILYLFINLLSKYLTAVLKFWVFSDPAEVIILQSTYRQRNTVALLKVENNLYFFFIWKWVNISLQKCKCVEYNHNTILKRWQLVITSKSWMVLDQGPQGRDNVAPSRVLVAVKAMSSQAWNLTQSHACNHSSWEAEAGRS